MAYLIKVNRKSLQESIEFVKPVLDNTTKQTCTLSVYAQDNSWKTEMRLSRSIYATATICREMKGIVNRILPVLSVQKRQTLEFAFSYRQSVSEALVMSSTELKDELYIGMGDERFVVGVSDFKDCCGELNNGHRSQQKMHHPKLDMMEMVEWQAKANTLPRQASVHTNDLKHFCISHNGEITSYIISMTVVEDPSGTTWNIGSSLFAYNVTGVFPVGCVAYVCLHLKKKKHTPKEKEREDKKEHASSDKNNIAYYMLKETSVTEEMDVAGRLCFISERVTEMYSLVTVIGHRRKDLKLFVNMEDLESVDASTLDDCPICMEPLCNKDVQAPCGHMLHINCLHSLQSSMMKSKRMVTPHGLVEVRCPMCRRSIPETCQLDMIHDVFDVKPVVLFRMILSEAYVTLFELCPAEECAEWSEWRTRVMWETYEHENIPDCFDVVNLMYNLKSSSTFPYVRNINVQRYMDNVRECCTHLVPSLNWMYVIDVIIEDTINRTRPIHVVTDH